MRRSVSLFFLDDSKPQLSLVIETGQRIKDFVSPEFGKVIDKVLKIYAEKNEAELTAKEKTKKTFQDRLRTYLGSIRFKNNLKP